MTGNKLNMAVGLIILLLTTAGYGGSGDVTVSGTVTARAFITEKIPTNINGELVYSTDVTTESEIIYEVPPGQRYVIESVSVWSIPSTCAFYLMPITRVEAGGNGIDFFLPEPDRTYSLVDAYRHHATWPIKLYADSASTVLVGAIRSKGGCSTTVHFSLAGYLEYQEQHRLP